MRPVVVVVVVAAAAVVAVEHGQERDIVFVLLAADGLVSAMACRAHAATTLDCGQFLLLSTGLVDAMFALAAAVVEEESYMLPVVSSTNSCRHARQPWVA